MVLWAVARQNATAQSLLLRPEYSNESVVNAASNRPARFSPNSIVTIYGKNLALNSWAISPDDLARSFLPGVAAGVEVRYLGTRTPLFFVSPTQINFLIPPDATVGTRMIYVRRDIVDGPTLTIRLEAEAPEIFRAPEGFAAATHADGRIVTEAAPAEEDEVIVVYGTGFGPLKVSEQGVIVPQRASEVIRAREYRVRLNGEELPPGAIFYVGVTPGFAGLYQINVRLPKPLPENPRFEIGIGGNWSADDVRLRTKKIATPDPL